MSSDSIHMPKDREHKQLQTCVTKAKQTPSIQSLMGTRSVADYYYNMSKPLLFL